MTQEEDKDTGILAVGDPFTTHPYSEQMFRALESAREIGAGPGIVPTFRRYGKTETITTLAAILGLVTAGGMSDLYPRRGYSPEENPGRTQTQEEKEAALKKAQEKRDKKLAKRLKSI